jgi:hypothetical protein
VFEYVWELPQLKMLRACPNGALPLATTTSHHWMPSLPTDLLEKVVQHLDWDHDRNTLGAAALSAKCFLVPCQKILFYLLDLSRGGPNSPAMRLLELFRVSPHLAAYVRFTAVIDVVFFFMGARPKKKDWEDGRIDWLVQDPAAADLLGILAEVGRTTTFYCCLSSKTGYWDSLPAKTKAAIVSLCSSSSLSRLIVDSVPLLSVDFKAGPALKHMNVQLEDKGYHASRPLPPSTHPLPKLHSLTILGTEATFDFAVGRTDLAHLQHLEVVKDTIAAPKLGRVLSLCHSLETLIIPSSCRFICMMNWDSMLTRSDCSKSSSVAARQTQSPCLL